MKSTGITFCAADKWAPMTSEALDLLYYEEKEAIPIKLDTVVSKLNIFLMCEKSIK